MTEAAETWPDGDIRPVVGRAQNNRMLWFFGGILAVSAIGLFAALEARRATISSPSITAPMSPGMATIEAPPELTVPPDTFFYGYPAAPQPVGVIPAPRTEPLRPSATMSPRAPATTSLPPASTSPASPYPFPGSSASSISRDVSGFPGPEMRPQVDEAAKDSSSSEDRVRAFRLANPSSTVPQGTVMHAVLETALDSNRAGFARAIISRDVTSFDGSRVLVPKGSKLFGEYQSDVSQGQNRALIRWRRLTRPDGVIIDVDSPSADPLGRAGVRGKVNSHFFERFSGAILQSALDLGVQVAARRASGNTYILGIPYGTQAINPIKPDDIKPTLTVRQGTSVSVFIARDLDFSDVGG